MVRLLPLDGLSKNFADVLFVLFSCVETKYNIENLAIGNTAAKGFYLQVKHTQNRPPLKLPSIFFDVSVTKNSISFTTNDVLMLNARAKQAIEEIYLQSDCIITKLINDIRTKISCFYTLTDIVAHADLVFSFAYQCSCSNYVRPQFNRYTEIINVSRCIDGYIHSLYNWIAVSIRLTILSTHFTAGHSSCLGEHVAVSAKQYSHN